MSSKLGTYFFAFLNILLKLKNFRGKKILIYTDSRGYNVIGKWGKIPFGSYVFRLCLQYRTDYFICTEKFTTIVDFLLHYEKQKLKGYDVVILHCGIVDFSPRPLSNIEKVRDSKKSVQRFEELFTKNSSHYERNHQNNIYLGEQTNTLYSLDYLTQNIIPELLEIPNLIWVNSNHFVEGWDGNYSKGRPLNIDEVVTTYETELGKSLVCILDNKQWSDQQIMEYTIDNIHFTEQGFKRIADDLNELISETLNTQHSQF